MKVEYNNNKDETIKYCHVFQYITCMGHQNLLLVLFDLGRFLWCGFFASL